MRAGNEDCIKIGEDKKPIISEELCIGCGICPKKCPAGCIYIINLPEELKSQALHRYTENGFKLFRTIVPIFGKTVGVLGANGIGKTTAISILAGLEYPNLGVPGDKPSKEKIIDYFKGTEAQAYFERLFNNDIKLAYKPQYVDAIPKKFKGKVQDLLEEVDEKNQLKEIVEELHISNILDRKVKDISGGELQRVAIAATILKDANVFFFDEPSSYLDIKQRLNMSRIVSNLSSKHTSVNVIEHDLIVLDYITDLTHIMYGQAGVYGVVAHPMSTRNGINSYLSGYIRDENMRFRSYPLKFEIKEAGKSTNKVELVEWPQIKKKLGDFELDVSPGQLYKNEVVGVLGENGTGKTTFAKILAGELKPDTGSVNKESRISYKPQYIKSDSNKTVEETLMAITDAYISDDFRISIIKPLQLERLLQKKVEDLSGGELQRVAIAVCLAREADIYLLDEPSAYLDVEQRLAIAKALRDIVKKKDASAIVVDHDLLFLDYLSDRLLVFKGEPSRSGQTYGPTDMRDGMNTFLKEVGITMRRDEQTQRPRVNKQHSVKDREQKEKGEYYYT